MNTKRLHTYNQKHVPSKSKDEDVIYSESVIKTLTYARVYPLHMIVLQQLLDVEELNPR
jgi:hypothetical protein